MTCQQTAKQTMYDLSTDNQTDHVCTGRKFRRSLQDGCVKRGADVASDHHLLIAKLKVKLKKMLLKDTTKQQDFNIVL